jgi:D-methionine transport system ATP-binding protein
MLTLTDLRKEFTVEGTRVTALDGISLTVPNGVIHGVVGHSGAGKSTLVRCLTGLERPTAGTVRLGDQEISELSGADLRAARRRIGMVFQHVNLMDSRTAAENVELPLELDGMPRTDRRERVAELLATVGLQDRGSSYPAQLSGGERQRVGIARALATEPEVLLFDEPTSALDGRTTRQVLDLIRELRERLGITVLVITHDMNVVRQVCDSATLLSAGRVVQTGTLDAVLRAPGSPLADALIPLPPLAPGDHGSLVEVSFSGGTGTVGDVIGLLAEGGVDADIVAGTIETLAGRRVGRLQLLVGTGDVASVEQVLAGLDADGINAEARA